jgi:hypothetical protein
MTNLNWKEFAAVSVVWGTILIMVFIALKLPFYWWTFPLFLGIHALLYWGATKTENIKL